MNNPIIAFFTHLADQRKERLYAAIREFMRTYEQSKRWTAVRCQMCQSPAESPDARFCAFCGASLYVSSAKLHPAFEQERNTGPVQQVPGQRFLEYVRERHQDTGPRTALHRAVHQQKEKVQR